MFPFSALPNRIKWMWTLFLITLCQTLANQSTICPPGIQLCATVPESTYLGQLAYHVTMSGGRSADEALVIILGRICGYLQLLVFMRVVSLVRMFSRTSTNRRAIPHGPAINAAIHLGTFHRSINVRPLVSRFKSFGEPTALDDIFISFAWELCAFLNWTIPVHARSLGRLYIRTVNAARHRRNTCSHGQTNQSEIMGLPPAYEAAPPYEDVPDVQGHGCACPEPPPYEAPMQVSQLPQLRRALMPGETILDVSSTQIALSGIVYRGRITNFSQGECKVTARVLLAFVPPLKLRSDHLCCIELQVVNGTHGARNDHQVSSFDAASDSSIWYSSDIRIANCQRIGHCANEHLRVEYGKQDLIVKFTIPKNSYGLGNRAVYYVLLDLEKCCWPDLRRLLPAMTFPFHFTGKKMSRFDSLARGWRGSQSSKGAAASRTIKREEGREMVTLAESIGSARGH